MIFLTVGTQVPFDRLVSTVDDWAGETREDVFAQIGETDLAPLHLEAVSSLDPASFEQRLTRAEAIIAHAGMGTIIDALLHGKPLVVMPRRASLGEHRSEHQLATARYFKEQGLVHVAMDELELRECLERLDELRPLGKIDGTASSQLLDAIRRFL